MTPIPAMYQPGGSGTVLQWRVYAPNAGPGPWPVVLVIHGGGFTSGSPFQMPIERLSQKLAQEGFYVLNACYRVAPCGRIPGQYAHDQTQEGIGSGRPPQQTDDVMSLVRAARADSHGVGKKLGIVGSSSGGTLAVYTALYTSGISGTGRPDWNQNGHDDRPDCAVSFSGLYDLSDQIPADDMNDPDFLAAIQNYTNTCDRTIQRSKSPIALIGPGTASSFKPLFVVNASRDMVVPGRQIFDLQCALEGAGVNPAAYTVLQITDPKYYRDHALSLWNDPDPNTHQTVGDDVIYFLHQHLD